MTATFHVGDAIEVMSKLPEKSVDLVLTSPPFLALRSYLPADHPNKALEGGSQSTPGEYIDWLIDVVEACDRVLAPHGSLCIELGDTYAGGGSGLANYSDDRGNPDGMRDTTFSGGNTKTGGGTGWPLAKSLSLIPELFRFTLVYGFNPLTGRQTERWRLRNVVRWVRPNPPVGALGDKFRPATSELMVFCKSAKRYFDLDAVREPLKQPETEGNQRREGAKYLGSKDQPEVLRRYEINKSNAAGAPPLDWWNIPLLEGEEETRYGPKPEKPYDRPNLRGHGSRRNGDAPPGQRPNTSDHTTNSLGSPPLDWWNIPPGGYEGAHYAVWPPELCVKPVKAMCPEKVCRVCGEPSRRIVKRDEPPDREVQAERRRLAALNGSGLNYPSGKPAGVVLAESWTDCGHNDWRPGLVLDPFVGSGTTLMVATGHGRDAIGIDLDERNFELALERVGPFILERAS